MDERSLLTVCEAVVAQQEALVELVLDADLYGRPSVPNGMAGASGAFASPPSAATPSASSSSASTPTGSIHPPSSSAVTSTSTGSAATPSKVPSVKPVATVTPSTTGPAETLNLPIVDWTGVSDAGASADLPMIRAHLQAREEELLGALHDARALAPTGTDLVSPAPDPTGRAPRAKVASEPSRPRRPAYVVVRRAQLHEQDTTGVTQVVRECWRRTKVAAVALVETYGTEEQRARLQTARQRAPRGAPLLVVAEFGGPATPGSPAFATPPPAVLTSEGSDALMGLRPDDWLLRDRVVTATAATAPGGVVSTTGTTNSGARPAAPNVAVAPRRTGSPGAARPAAPAASGSARSRGAGLGVPVPRGAVVLIVDDEPDIVESLAIFIHHAAPGVEIVTASSAEGALKQLRQRPVALILSDLRMPGMDGISLLGEAKRLAPDARRYLITAYPGPDVDSRARKEADVAAVLRKPVALEGLQRMLQDLPAVPEQP